MEFKLNQENAIDSAITGVSTMGGAVASKGLMGIAPEGLKKPIVRAGLSLLTLAIASGVQGDDALAKSTKGFLLGVSVEQGVGAVAKAISPSVKDTPTTKGEKFVAAIAGMNAPEENGYQSFEAIPMYDWNQDASFAELASPSNNELLTPTFQAV
ncbi:hypothetical protein [Tenacibaculum aiptasiae]|uniref:hypothetical protein n=1 Tax=Tenacibaculum aiptasiae TaxID=426481 RepID=UPI00232AA869|nr:hypothetical protein [Tenacibaculum aiptasiae]